MTRFDLDLEGEEYGNLPKSQLIRRIIHHAIASGHTPAEIEEAIACRAQPFRKVVGSLKKAEFCVENAKTRIADNSLDDSGRFFTDDEQLYHHDGFTYALTKMWGSKTLTAIGEVQKAFPELEFEFSPVGGAKGEGG